MITLVPLAWRSLLARRARTVFTMAGIALGVGMLHAALLTSAGIDRAVERTVQAIMGRADIRVTAFQERGLSANTLAAIDSTPGVAGAAPAIEQRLYLRRPASGMASAPVLVRGIDPVRDPLVHDLVPARGAGLSGAVGPAALVTDRLAAEDGLELGSDLVLQAAGEPMTVRIVGIVGAESVGLGASGRGVIVPIDVARAVNPDAGISRVDLRLDTNAAPATVTAVLARTLVADPYILSTPADLAASLRAATADFEAILSMLAAVALFAGSVLVFNTLSLTVVERSREVGLLRAAGATSRQVVGFVLAGAATLGLIGSLLGLVIGAGLSVAVGPSIAAGGIANWDRPPVDALTAAFAAATGLAIAVLAGVEPAWRATRISALEAVRLRVDPAGVRRARLPWVLAGALAVGGLGLLVWPGTLASGAALRSLGVYSLLVVAVLLAPVVINPLVRIVGLPFALISRLDERLARGSLVRDRGRTALTLGALAVGLAMMVAVGSVAQHARASAGAWLASVIPGDEVVTSIRPVGFDEGVADALAAVPGVTRITPVGSFNLAWRGIRLDGAAVSGAGLLADGRLVFQAGDRADALRELESGGAVIVARSTAERHGLRLGDTMTLAAGGGATVDLRIAGVVDRSLPGRTGEAVLVGWNDAATSFGVAGADFFAVRFDASGPATAREDMRETARALALVPAPLEAVEGAVSNALGRVFGLFDALALVAVLIAAMGIFNTMTMSVVERVRELGILRAAGMSAGQVFRMVIVEAGILGLVGGVVGVAAGSLAGLLMIGWGTSLSVAWVPPLPLIGLALLLGLVVSMLAAWYPARVAGRISIIRAVQVE